LLNLFWLAHVKLLPFTKVGIVVGRIGAGILAAQSPFSRLLSAVASIERGLPRHE